MCARSMHTTTAAAVAEVRAQQQRPNWTLKIPLQKHTHTHISHRASSEIKYGQRTYTNKVHETMWKCARTATRSVDCVCFSLHFRFELNHVSFDCLISKYYFVYCVCVCAVWLGISASIYCGSSGYTTRPHWVILYCAVSKNMIQLSAVAVFFPVPAIYRCPFFACVRNGIASLLFASCVDTGWNYCKTLDNDKSDRRRSKTL